MSGSQSCRTMRRSRSSRMPLVSARRNQGQRAQTIARCAGMVTAEVGSVWAAAAGGTTSRENDSGGGESCRNSNTRSELERHLLTDNEY